MVSPTGTFCDRTAETMPREELEELQAERIRTCLRRMQASDTGYYREGLSGVDPDRIRSADDLRRLPFTVPLAASGLTPIVGGAAVFHVSRREIPPALVTAILPALAVFVAYARFFVIPL